MDWDMIVGYNFMIETESRVPPAQASMTPYQEDQLSWLLSFQHNVECKWIHPERHRLQIASLGVGPAGPTYPAYGVKPEVGYGVAADLGTPAPARDTFSLGISAHLRVCEKYWSAQDSAPKKQWVRYNV